MFLRALGYIWTPLAAFLWFLTIVATFIAMLPIARTTIVPVYGGTINEIFHDFAVPFAFALAISNGLSGRWGPEGLRWLDLSSSRLGFWGMALICLMVFALVSFWSGYHLANWDFWFLVSLLLFGWYDKSVQQGEAYRSSTMRGLTPVIPPSRQASAGGAPNPRRPSGILAPFVALGLTRILVPNELVVIEVDDGGGYDYDLPNMNQARLTALAAEAVSPQAGQHPAPATAAPAVAPAAP